MPKVSCTPSTKRCQVSYVKVFLLQMPGSLRPLKSLKFLSSYLVGLLSMGKQCLKALETAVLEVLMVFTGR